MERNDGALLVRLPIALKEEVDAVATEFDMSTNAWLRAIIKRALLDRQRKVERRAARQTERAA